VEEAAGLGGEDVITPQQLEAMAKVLGADQLPFRCCTSDLPVPVDEGANGWLDHCVIHDVRDETCGWCTMEKPDE